MRKLQKVYVAVSKTSCWGPLEPLCPDEHLALVVMPWLGKILLGFYCKDSMAAQNGKSNQLVPNFSTWGSSVPGQTVMLSSLTVTGNNGANLILRLPVG